MDPALQSVQVHHREMAPLEGDGDPSHKGVHLPVGVLGAPLPSPSAPLPCMPSDRLLPQHLQASGTMLPLQRPPPMSARHYLLHQTLLLLPVWGIIWARSAYCPFNRRAQQLYADFAREGKPLHAINTQLRELDLPSLLTHRRPRLSPSSPAPTKPNQSPATAIHPGVQFSTIVTRNRFGPLEEALEDDMPLCLRITSSPLCPTALLLLCGFTRGIPLHQRLS